jgi:hypothetical protein
LQAFGSNVAGVNGAGAASFANRTFNPADLLLGNSTVNMASAMGAGAPASNPAGAAPSVPAGGTTVNVTNHYKTVPDDPHQWAQGIAWELGSAI